MFVIIFLCMIFFHIVDDFYLQGILAKMKQKSWWRDQTDNKLYHKDWIPALIAHGISWTFMMMLPCNVYLLIYKPDNLYWFSLIFIWNVFMHCRVDHEKCNRLTINLITDQATHLMQIGLTFMAFLLFALG